MIVEKQYLKLDLPEGNFKLELGGVLSEIDIAFETYGTLSQAKDNVVFICHALTGDAHVAGRHEGDEKDTGWWSNMVRSGGGIDIDEFYVVCANILGGCSGTTGPSSINPQTGRPYGSLFPNITVGDIVTVHKMFLEQIGFEKIYAIIGGSFGGMQALEFSVRFPGFSEKCIAVATGACLTTQALAFDLVGRDLITNDPNWNDGDYYENGAPGTGLAQARKLAHITYLSGEMMKQKFGRRRREVNLKSVEELAAETLKKFEIETYLDHQGQKFIKRFDANSYIHITRAMDEYDLESGFDSLAESLSRTLSRNLVVALSGDWLFLPEQSEDISKALSSTQKDVSYFCLDADAGHDAFLTHVDELIEVISNFLTRKPDMIESELSAAKSSDYSRLINMIPTDIESILDLACYDGALLKRIKQQFPGIKVTGVDIDCKALLKVLRTGYNAMLADVDAGLKNIPDDAFDCAVLSESLQVMKRPDKVLQELLRIAPVGLVSFPNFAVWRIRISLLFKGRMPKTRQLPYEWYNTPNIHLCTIRDFFDLCESLGIGVEKAEYMSTSLFGRILNKLGMKNLGASRVLVKISR
jgi:homoserine O-acetyltransferase